MELFLIDTSPVIVSAWDRVFFDLPEIVIEQGNILDRAENTIVSPANSYGYMDGGIDRVYRDFFGTSIENTVQDSIKKKWGNYLPVGSSILVQTGSQTIPYLIVAPTMFLPEPIKPQNCFYAMSAILNAVDKHKNIVSKVFCPGLGTGVGQVEPIESAKEMKAAYLKWKRMA